MRFAPSSAGSRLRSCFALLALGISACGSSDKPKLEPGKDAGSDAKSDTAGDTRADVKPDVARDVPPAPVDVQNPLCSGVSPTTDFSDPYVIADFETATDQTFAPFGTGMVSGGTYPALGTGYPFTDTSGLNWHISGTVGPTDDAHFGIYWQCTLPTASGG